jgi:hypothetical protein
MISTFNDIQKIINSTEKEKANVELKSFLKIVPCNDESRKDIAAEIAAFANRNGGTIIFGINNDGSFDDLPELNIDKAKETLHHISYNNISPVVDCNTKVIEEGRNIFIILYVPKRKGIPHAYIEKRTNHEIKSRTYYIRTSHGKRLVSDGQLQWLFFNQEEPDYEYQFRVAFEFYKSFELTGSIVPWGNYEICNLRDLLTEPDKSAILNDSNKFISFLNGLMPYMILGSLAEYFKDSWHIGVNKGFDRLSSGAMITDFPIDTTACFMHETPVEGDSFVHNLSWDFTQILKELYPGKMHLPVNTSIIINYADKRTASSIHLKNRDFKIEILTGMLSGGAGLHQKGVLHHLLTERYSTEEQQASLGKFLHYDAAGYLTAQFNYPEYDMNDFEKYLTYYHNLKTLLGYNWDYDSKRLAHPPDEAVVMDDKLNEILAILKRTGK